MTVKRTNPQGSRATWMPLAVVAPLAAATFLGSIGFAASVTPSDQVATTPVSNVQLVSTTKSQLPTKQTVASTHAVNGPAPVKTTTQTQRTSAPPVHALTRASGV